MLLGKNAQRSHQINQGGMNQQLGGAFGSLFGNPQSSFQQPIGMGAAQQPMQAIFPSLFPTANNQPMMGAFPFMMAPPQQMAQQNPVRRPPPQPSMASYNPVQMVAAPQPVMPNINPYPNLNMNQPTQMNVMNPNGGMQQQQPNPLAMFNMGGNPNINNNNRNNNNNGNRGYQRR